MAFIWHICVKVLICYRKQISWSLFESLYMIHRNRSFIWSQAYIIVRGSENGKSFITFVTRNTLRECPFMGYNFRVGRVVLNDPLKLVLIHLKLQHIVSRVVEYMFLQAGKFMPGMEKLAGELFFPTNQQLFLGEKSSSTSFFWPGINFSAYRIHFPV